MVGLERGTVALEPYDPAWKRHYADEAARLEEVAGDRLLAVEHVGSTAVEGLAAKPIVDVLALVRSLEAGRELIPRLEEHGYDHRPNDGVDDRLFLAKGPETERTHYLSLTERGSDTHREQVAFRDYLRTHPGVAAEYEALKRDLAAANPDDRAAYTAAKGEFVEGVLERALEEG